ncbi:YIP1 family protein [Paenibacillus harenae]|uniref:Glucan phosphoethanolaminetransferase (Alkaline phosphatase superfamily) n=1 Tax=Paenibacillus harenae TaxID=306543 RepID=A0ABT9U1J5_PAEHA|nr:YIP1 family protein [Paenibacillus harenae]MDQ0112289.1 glucan phosphoethanolaminetransferase (alkaline phosphatase superfamily) [Paenibacillus harenae]
MIATFRLMRQVLVHPIDFFHDIQEPGRIRWRDAIFVMALTYIARMVAILVTGYAFETREPYEISFLHEFIWMIAPWLTWTVANWAVSAILEGEGKFKEVFVGSAFAFVPYAIFIVPITLMTNFIALDEDSIYNFLINFTIYWAGWLLLLKVRIIHDFEIVKMLWITFLSIVGVLIIWFVGILMFGLMNQLINFVVDLFKEINFRR